METLFKKLNCKDIIDLTLFVPKDYENTFFSKTLSETPLIVKVIIQSYTAGHNKMAKIDAWLPLFQQKIELIIFHPSSYHKQKFSIGSEHIISGKPNYYNHILQIIQPKIINQTEDIVPIFPTLKGLSQKNIRVSLANIITVENLVAHNIPLHYAQELQKIYLPDKPFFEQYKKQGGFPPLTLRALKFVEIYRYLLKLRSKNKKYKAPKIAPRNPQQFIDSLPFVLTTDQIQAIHDIEKDFHKQTSTRRVVVGDVGCGKSLVIFAAAYMIYPKRCLLMAPTSLLAHQLYEESKKYLPQDINIVLVNTEKNMNYDSAHIIIGTHALLWKEFSNIALVMIDEQHRFGVKHRHILAQHSAKTQDDEAVFEKIINNPNKNHIHPHVIQFSATPIPRTLAMIESSFVDFSFIKKGPFKREVSTIIIKKNNFAQLLGHIQQEIRHHRQIAIIYPSINESETSPYRSLSESQEFWYKHFKNVYTTHGKDKDKELILNEFKEKGDILLTTTIIEVGISLPRLCTIIISGAEHFGLATLHQLRGRVSRNGLKGYCFLFTHREKTERLQLFIQCQNGFEVAELDLSLRKSGDILHGMRQSGEEFHFLSLSDDIDIIQEAKQFIQNIPKKQMLSE